MKVASFNINNVNRRLDNLIDWLRKAEPDVVCLQELKAADTEFPAKALARGRVRGGVARPKELERVAILARTAPISPARNSPAIASTKAATSKPPSTA